MTLFGAIDIGASSGRVIAGEFKAGRVLLTEVYRFPNKVVSQKDRLVWDFYGLMGHVRTGLRELGARAERLGLDVTSVGVDTWGVDYGVLRNGELIATPNSYRDPLNQLGVEKVHGQIPFPTLHAINGIQFLPFNSIYQISRQIELDAHLMEESDTLLLIPDLIGFFLSGLMATERTNASTTGLLDAKTGDWSQKLGQELSVQSAKFPKIRDAGEYLGPLKSGFGERLENTQLVLVGSHDTASAVVAVPADDEDFAYLSSGTWSLLGMELEAPVLSEASRLANFTNEIGVDGKVRFLKNLSGLWLLSECLRSWDEQGKSLQLEDLLEKAKFVTPISEIDVSDQNLIAPDEMPSRIARQLERSGQSVPQSPEEYVALILHSLAKTYAKNLFVMEELTGKKVGTLHVIGGGSQNKLLCQLTADYCGKAVLAGPIEATAMGNILVQARSAGLVGQTLADLRKVVRSSDLKMELYKPNERVA